MGEIPTRTLDSVYGETGAKGKVPRPAWEAQRTHLVDILEKAPGHTCLLSSQVRLGKAHTPRTVSHFQFAIRGLSASCCPESALRQVSRKLLLRH